MQYAQHCTPHNCQKIQISSRTPIQSVRSLQLAAAFRFEDLIVGAKPRHRAKPLVGKLLLPKLHRARREEFHHQNYHVFQFACREGDEAKLNDCRGMIFLCYKLLYFTLYCPSNNFYTGLFLGFVDSTFSAGVPKQISRISEGNLSQGHPPSQW